MNLPKEVLDEVQAELDAEAIQWASAVESSIHKYEHGATIVDMSQRDNQDREADDLIKKALTANNAFYAEFRSELASRIAKKKLTKSSPP